ncbi:sensor histidine kinase [Parvibaculum lavamentivorans]|uniref:sensor histidine kinase n=1 Tax=Parvibaculum lavamentivorans TaxID=256618 RepID=UPI00067494F1|nr:HAMP domain-containing sensor histidine kinase [Parvibaculum lavamentivorans]
MTTEADRPAGTEAGQPQEAVFPGTVRRNPPIETRIVAEQVKLLLSLGEASRWTIFGGILVVGLAFYQTAPIWATAVVAAIQLIAQFAFDRVRAGFNADPDNVEHAPKWAHRYALVTLISGATWGVGALLWLPDSSFAHEVFYMAVLAALVMATAVSRATYPPAVIYYTLSSCLPAVIMFATRGDALSVAAVLLALMFFATIMGWTRRINEGYREAFRLRFENADLVERMARAHAATEQRRRDAEEAEARAKAAMQAKQEFLDIISHEVREPLDGLRNMALYLGDEAVNETQIKIAASIEETSQLLRRLVDDMIDFSEIESKSLELKPRSFDPVELTASVVRMMRHQAVTRGLSLELDVAPGIDALMTADADRLRQVLSNLIGNAIKFTYQGGVVVRVASLKTPGGETVFRFSVTDTGPGLAEDARARLFEAFTQGADARDYRFSGQTAGVGLGLPISERLVRLMGGHIDVDSTVGQGSTFWFLLPSETGGAREYFAALCDEARPDGTAKPERLIDHDHLYELERRLGGHHITDHLVTGLQRVLALHRDIEQARSSGNGAALAEGALSLKTAAADLGLTAIATVADNIGTAAGQGEQEAAMREVPRLQQKIAATWRELAKVYPSLAA